MHCVGKRLPVNNERKLTGFSGNLKSSFLFRYGTVTQSGRADAGVTGVHPDRPRSERKGEGGSPAKSEWENDRLAALWRLILIALRGLRRAQAAALGRDDLDSDAASWPLAVSSSRATTEQPRG
jgi:hypothetical protein